MPGTPIPTPNSSPEDLYLSEIMANGFAHVVQDVVTAQHESVVPSVTFSMSCPFSSTAAMRRLVPPRSIPMAKVRHKVTKGN